MQAFSSTKASMAGMVFSYEGHHLGFVVWFFFLVSFTPGEVGPEERQALLVRLHKVRLGQCSEAVIVPW